MKPAKFVQLRKTSANSPADNVDPLSPLMAIVEHHTSSDGVLRLIVDQAEDGDWTVGFSASAPSREGRERFGWRTHGDLLDGKMWGYLGTSEERVRAFVDDVISSRRVIVIWRRDGRFVDVQVEDDWSANDSHRDRMKYAEPGESFEKRLWNGQPVVG